MTNFNRALSTIAVSAVISTGLVAGSAVPADAHPAHRAPTAQRGLLDLIPLQLPLLSGLGGIGSLLSVTEPLWNLPGVTNDIVWLRDGLPIPGTDGLWEYLPTDLDAGHEISAQVTGTLFGILPLTLITNALGIPLPGATAPSATTAPTVSGDPKVGTLLSATAPVWDTDVDSTNYQWLRSGVAIAGATTNKYTVAPEDVAKTISVRTTGVKGDAQGVATSAPVLAKIGDAIAALTAPSISGNGRVGSLLSSSPGTWTGLLAPAFGYQWLRDGTAISGATGSTYVARAADAGRSLTLRVAATRPGYLPGAATTSGLQIAKMSTTTRAALVKKTVAKGAKGLLKIILNGNGAKPSGIVKVYDGAKLLKSYPIRSSDNGSRTVELPKLKPGTHQLKAVFGGSSAFTGSASKVARLKVTK
ncbi:MAG: hypothetical protein JWO11_3778 [Nocardioides sp.]|nr:hypothetical protein [Nocardioides sp.]